MGRAIQVEFLLAGIKDSSGNPLSGGKVYTYSAGTTTNKTTWTDSGKVTSAANPVILDSNGKALIYADGIYKIVIKDSSDNTLYAHDNLNFFMPEGAPLWGGQTSGTSTAYAITLPITAPAIPAYQDGQVFTFYPHADSGATATLNVNSLGAKTLQKGNGSAITTKDLITGKRYQAVYDSGSGTMRILDGPLSKQLLGQFAVVVTTAAMTNTHMHLGTVTASITDANSVGIVAPFAMTITDLSCRIPGASTLSASMDIKLFKNGIDTSQKITLASGSNKTQGTLTTFQTLAAGDFLDLAVNHAGVSAGANFFAWVWGTIEP